MVITHAQPRPEDVGLVLGAGSGVGLAAVQIAKLAGARVIATASTDAKLARIEELEPITINYARDEQWGVTVRRLTDKRGADVIIETVGAATWEKSIRALGKGGRLVTSGATSGPIGPTDGRPSPARRRMEPCARFRAAAARTGCHLMLRTTENGPFCRLAS